MELRIVTVYATLACAAFSYAAPGIALPFNSQVPTVARVGQAYLFQLSASTFNPEASNVTYELSNEPSWLSIDGSTRTLSGTPGQDDVGVATFLLSATDDTGTAQMPCTLIVSSDPAPRLQGDVSEQLATTSHLSSDQPPVVAVQPSSTFVFQFQQNSFIDIVQRKLFYYATLTDHTPLPSWLSFDPQALTFTGTTPDLSATPQSWSVDLIASDVAGFAGATASFTITIGMQQLVFTPAEQTVNISAGMHLAITTLQSQLFRNGVPLGLDSLANANVGSLPSWLVFDSRTLSLVGIVPPNVASQAITVTAIDDSGDSATAFINLIAGSQSLFSGTIEPVVAYSGKPLDYYFADNMFSESDVDLRLTLPPSAAWLHFNSSARILSGMVPSQSSPTTIQATISAKSSDVPVWQSETFGIDIKMTAVSPSGSAPASSASSFATSFTNGSQLHSRLSRGVIAAIIVLCLVAATLLVICLILCFRHRRRYGWVRRAPTPDRSMISRPLPLINEKAIMRTTELQRDVERDAVAAPAVSPKDRPPQLALDLPSRTTSKTPKWMKRFSHISQASSLGVGEEAIKRDANIPEWGEEPAVLNVPHDSFSVPAALARVSRGDTQPSPTKRAMRRLREGHASRDSVGLGIDTGEAILMPRHSSRMSRNHRRRHSSHGLSATLDRSSQASLSTRGTSVLSARASDFPRPPTRPGMTSSRSIPVVPLTDADKRKSIRLLGRTDTIVDRRSLHDRRQSYIRNRASSTWQSPLFAHGSRASSDPREPGMDSVTASSAGNMRFSRSGRAMLPTYSESSSLGPQGRASRTLSARLRSSFAPNFPRAVTRSSLGADDEGAADQDDSSWTTTSSSSESDLISPSDAALMNDLALPRHKRGWVIPGECSPTPPPAPPTSRQASSVRSGAHFSASGGSRQRSRGQVTSLSPLSTAVMVPVVDNGSYPRHEPAANMTRSRISEPISLVSNDSVSRAHKMERPRLVHTNSKRPVSVDEVARMSSMKVLPSIEPHSLAGSERQASLTHDADVEGSGLMPESGDRETQGSRMSAMSGPVFL